MLPLRVLLVDDHEGVRKSIRDLLSTRSDWTVCGEAANGIDAIEQTRLLMPDVVLMDISMPGMDGLEATRKILHEFPHCKVVIISQNHPSVARNQAVAVGAKAFVAKNQLSRELVSTVEGVANQENSNTDRTLQSEATAKADVVAETEGTVGQLVREFDWAKTPVGPIGLWSESLKTLVSVLLSSRFAMWMSWGPDLTFFYNDAYRRMTLGKKHPWALGRPSREVWAEIWDDIGPRIQRVLDSGEATWDEALLLFLERSGYREETYHTFSYSPLADNNGRISGHLCVVTEETERVIGERRLRTLRSLAAELNKTITEEQVCASVVRSLSENQKDLPFSLIYLFRADGKQADLACQTGIEAGHAAAPSSIYVNDREELWPVSEIWKGHASVIVENLSDRFVWLPSGAWDASPSSAILVPITSQGQDRPAGVFVAALNPYRQLDTNYKGFVDLVAGQIAASIANARAYDEERKRAEALAEIDRAKTLFFSNVSHEFRTPLTLILGPLQDLLARSQTHLSPMAKEQIELANRNGARLMRLVNTLLDFSRIEAGRVQAVYQSTDVATFTAELASVFRSAADRAGIGLAVNCKRIEEPAYIDRDMWEKIVLNLVSNAFKFTFQGEIEVGVRQVGRNAELCVRDTGVGIPSEEIPHLFDRFHRVPNTRSRTHEGSGIGLALVHELVKIHGGSMRVESIPERGSNFIVCIPLGKDHLPAEQIGRDRTLTSTAIGANPFVEEALRWLPDENLNNRSELPFLPESLPTPDRAVTEGGDSKSRVLVVDDNADMRHYLTRLLTERYDVVTAADGQEALTFIHESLPDLVVSDIMMPNLDGIGLIKEIRSDPATTTLPVILLSARAAEEARVQGLDAGADDYLVKPFSSRELLARISARLTITQLRTEADKALRESEERFRALVNASSDVVYRMSPDWKYMHQLDGKGHLSNTQNPTKDWLSEYIPAEEHPRIRKAIADAIEAKKLFSLEHQVKRSDGTIVWTFSRAIPVLDGNGEIVEWFGFASDVTARREADENYRKLAESLDVEVRDRTRELESRNADVLRQAEQLRDLSYRLMRTQDEERRHIARELHDSAGQTLAVLGMHLAQIAQKAGKTSPEVLKETRNAEDLFQQLQKEIRTTSYLLHPPLLDDAGLSSALAWYIEGLKKRSGLSIQLNISEDFGRVPRDMELVIFRLVQECLTNIHRHSGADSACIRIERSGGAIAVEVADNGTGMPREKLTEVRSGGYGVGLRGMRERVRQFHGEMRIESDSSGTKILIALPLPKDEEGTHLNSLDAHGGHPIATGS